MSAPHFSSSSLHPPPPDSPPSPPPKLLTLPYISSLQAKKPHFLPWTHEETVNLIEAYQEKWYSLKRGQLKASQWEEVAVTVAARCGASPEDQSKTGTQCRHKIEKLRKRYRTERQRLGPCAWQYFDLMDRMERGPLPISVVPPVGTVNRRHLGGKEEYVEVEKEVEDYGGWIGSSGGEMRRRKSETDSRVSGGRRLDECGEMVNGFVEKLGGSFSNGGGYDSKMRPCSNNTKFQKRKFAAYEEENDDEGQDDDDDEPVEVNGIGEGGKRGKKNDGNLMELAVKMREFAASFVRIEKRKIEVMRETERYRLQMENKRMEMIVQAQKKAVDFISMAFSSPARHNHHPYHT